MNDSEGSFLEGKKRKREIIVILCLSALFLLLTWFEFNLFGISKKLPLIHSVFFFGLVNFNIIILLTLLFLIFRNVVKSFVSKKGRFLGSSLKSKLVISFLSFSIVPTVLMFLISIFYINNSFDKWFNVKISSVLRNSLEVNNEFFSSTKKRNYHFAQKISEKISSVENKESIYEKLGSLRKEFLLDSVDYYDAKESLKIFSSEKALPNFPLIEKSFLQKGLVEKSQASTVQHFEAGSLIRVIEPIKVAGNNAVIVVSTFVPLSLVKGMDDVTQVYEEFKDINPIEYPIKSIYLIVLVLMTLVILLAASWFGFYLAKRLSVPLVKLSNAAKRISRRKFELVEAESGSTEVDELVKHFNVMTSDLESSSKKIEDANKSLNKMLGMLDEKNRYMEVILSNINTGVVAVDDAGKIASINKHAEKLLKIKAEKYIGCSVRKILSDSYYENFFSMLKVMKEHKATFLQKEFHIQVKGRSVPVQMSLTLLQDEVGRHLGQVLVFDDLTVMVNAQRAAAWREVARRIAHEIKNPLTPIKLSAQRIKKKYGEKIADTDFDEATEMIILEVDGLKNLVNEFSQFARMPESKPSTGDINQTICESLALFKMAHKNIKFDLQLDNEIPEFDFDQEQIKRALINLLDNAVSAVSLSKTPEISIQTRFDEAVRIVKLSIVDNGIGLKNVTMNQIFEPYFSTKESGTGLGLSIVKRIVEDHSGYIRVLKESEGLKIVLEFPVLDKKNNIILERLQVSELNI